MPPRRANRRAREEAPRRANRRAREEAPHSERLERRVAADEAGRRLVDVLSPWLRERLSLPVPMARVRALVVSGGVRVDGVVVRAAGRPLRRGQHVSALVEAERLRARAHGLDRPFALSPERILFDDGSVLAVDKPPGLPTHATADPSRPSLAGHVQAWLRERGRSVTLALHQRLDRDTTGIVLFGIDARANAGLAKAFADRLADKRYLALTASPVRHPPRQFRIEAPIGASGKGRTGVRVGGEGAQHAATDVFVREVREHALLVEARPLTGRRHQLRAHLALAGLPVLGDNVYGGPGPRVPRLMLHAWRLALPHPLTGERLAIESPIPADFAAVLAELRMTANSVWNA